MFGVHRVGRHVDSATTLPAGPAESGVNVGGSRLRARRGVVVVVVTLAVLVGCLASAGAALSASGPVWAWGYNGSGQLGNSSTSNSSTPVQVQGPGGSGTLSGVTTVAAGGVHSVALKSDGSVWAWGYNGYGQLGNNTMTNSLTPVQVLGPGGTGTLSGVVAIAAGNNHSLALKSDGSVWAWGNNAYGQLGNNTMTNSSTPVQVQGPGGSGTLSGVVAIGAGFDHSLAVKSDGSVWAWGRNSSGQLGNNSTTNSSTPVQVLGPGGTGTLSGVVAVAGGLEHSVAVKSDGTVWAWGLNAAGELGNNSTTNSSTPVQVLGPGGSGTLSGVVGIAAGLEHNVAEKSDGSVWTWGDNTQGELGDNSTTNSSTPVQVLGPGGTGTLSGVTAVATGWEHSLVLKSDGSVWAWGRNDTGQLGDNSTTNTSTPVQVLGQGGSGTFTAAAIGTGCCSFHSLAIAPDESIAATGNRSFSGTERAVVNGTVATFTDPDTSATPSEYSARINWGDGSPTSSGTVSGSGGSFSVSGSHAYAEEGSYTIKVTITDVDSSSKSATASDSASIADASLNATGIAASSPQAFSGTVANFTDADTQSSSASDFTATIDWGDGSPTSSGTVSGSGGSYSVSGSHNYRQAGSFAITVHIVDVGGSTADGSSAITISGGGTIVVTPSGPSVPAVTISPPTAKAPTSAAFSGSVNPVGASTTAYFQYGLDPRYAGGGPLVYTNQIAAAPLPVGSDSAAHFVSATATGLVPDALYHVRLVAVNGVGTTYGPDQTFTTGKDPPPPPPVLGKSFDLSPVSGQVYVTTSFSTRGGTLPSTGPGYVPLTDARQLRTGSWIDSRHGKFKLISASGKQGELSSGTFGGAIVFVSQTRQGPNRGLTTFKLLLGQFPGAPSLKGCSTKKASRGPASGGLLAQIASLSYAYHSSSHGRYRTRYGRASGSSSGTQWDTTVQCSGVLFTVFRGTVIVDDSARHKTVAVHAGHSYLAKR